MHGAHLVQALKAENPDLKFSGLGGPLMRQAGVEIYEDLTKIAVVGFAEVVKHYRDFRRVFFLFLQKVKVNRPDAVILIDYPGFNLRLARALKRLGIKVFYYISPQVWAWKENRINTVKTCVDHMLVIFEFEKEFYARHGLKVECVGHPLVDTIKIGVSREAFLKSLGLPAEHLTIGLLPGSRKKEIQGILPAMLDAACVLHKTFPSIQFLIFQARTVENSDIEPLLKKLSTDMQIKTIRQDYYDGINACDVCMVASGTATLETALLQKPMVVVYKTSLITWALAKALIKIPFIGLVNIVAGKKIVPECLQFQATGLGIARELRSILTDEVRLAEIKSELKALAQRLGPPGASRRAAQAILKNL